MRPIFFLCGLKTGFDAARIIFDNPRGSTCGSGVAQNGSCFQSSKDDREMHDRATERQQKITRFATSRVFSPKFEKNLHDFNSDMRNFELLVTVTPDYV